MDAGAENPIRLKRLEEQQELKELNGRLEFFLKRISEADAYTKDLESQMQVLVQTHRKEVQEVHTRSTKEVDELRHQVAKEVKERASLASWKETHAPELADLKSRLLVEQEAHRDSNKKRAALEQELQDVTNDRNDLDRQLKAAQHETERLEEELEKVQQALADAEARHESEHGTLHARVKAYEVEVTTLRRKAETVNVEDMEKHYRDLYNTRLQDALLAMTQRNDEELAIRKQELLRQYNERVAALESGHAIDEDGDAKLALQAEVAQLQKTLKQTEGKLAKADDKRAAAERVLEAKEELLQQSAEEYRDNQTRWESEITELRKTVKEHEEHAAKVQGDLRLAQRSLQEANSSADQLRDQNRDAASTTASYQGEVEELRRERDRLEEQYNQSEAARTAMEQKYQVEVDEKERMYRKKHQALIRKEKDFDELMDTKIALDREIARFRALMNGAEERVGIESPPRKKQKRSHTVVTEAVSVAEILERLHVEGAPLRIVDLDLKGDKVTLRNCTTDSLNLGGYKIRSARSNVTFQFEDDFELGAGEEVTVWSGAQHKNMAQDGHNLFWTTRYIWKNSGSQAELRAPDDSIVSQFSAKVDEATGKTIIESEDFMREVVETTYEEVEAEEAVVKHQTNDGSQYGCAVM